MVKQLIKKSLAQTNNVSQEKNIYTVLVDGNNLLKKALVNKTLNSDGVEYGAIMTFIRMLGNMLLKKNFDYCIVAWDGDNSGVLRWEIYPEYKANRDKSYHRITGVSDYDKYLEDYQRKVLSYHRNKEKKTQRGETDDEIFARERCIIQNILENLCVRQYMCENIEGDDIIAYYVKNKNKNEKVVIMSEDRDLTQLIADDVTVWIPSKQIFVTPKNDIEVLGKPAKNVVLIKTLCGDNSDNIYGIDGLGETTLFKHFPELKERECTLEAILERCNALLEERKANKKKPLKSLENIINRVTKGCQGKDIYEINKKIIDLSTPLLTKEAEEEISNEMYGELDLSERSVQNVYKIIQENKMQMLLNENSFANAFGSYSRIIEQERKRNEKK